MNLLRRLGIQHGDYFRLAVALYDDRGSVACDTLMKFISSDRDHVVVSDPSGRHYRRPTSAVWVAQLSPLEQLALAADDDNTSPQS